MLMAMKLLTQALSLGMLLVTLSSCDTYVEGRGHTRSNSGRRHYDSGPSHRSSSPSINANTNIGAGLRL